MHQSAVNSSSNHNSHGVVHAARYRNGMRDYFPIIPSCTEYFRSRIGFSCTSPCSTIARSGRLRTLYGVNSVLHPLDWHRDCVPGFSISVHQRCNVSLMDLWSLCGMKAAINTKHISLVHAAHKYLQSRMAEWLKCKWQLSHSSMCTLCDWSRHWQRAGFDMVGYVQDTLSFIHLIVPGGCGLKIVCLACGRWPAFSKLTLSLQPMRPCHSLCNARHLPRLFHPPALAPVQ